MGRPYWEKTSKIAHKIFKKQRIFKFIPSPTNHRATAEKFYMGAQLHSFHYTKA